MNKNYETANIIMEGAELLYSMLGELITGIRNLPGCRVTSNLKKTAFETEAASGGIFDTMKMVMTADEPCMECSEADEQDMTEADIPAQSDLEEFLGKVSELIASDNPVSISADIYINEAKPDKTDSKSEESE